MGAPRLINFASYPINYGMIPRTLLPVSRGGDRPSDVILLGDPLKQGQVVKAKPIGMMTMNDNGDQDDKIIAIPLNDELLNKVNDITDLKENYPDLLNEIKIWFENYKGNNVVEFLGFKNAQKANELIQFTERHFKRTGIKPKLVMGFRIEEKLFKKKKIWVNLKIFCIKNLQKFISLELYYLYFENNNFDMFHDSIEGLTPRKN